MSKLDLLKAAFTKSSNNSNESREPSNYFNFWNMQVDETATVRFLPDKNPDNPFQFMVEKHMHELTINGQKRRVPCLKMYGDECPVCKVSSGYYKEGDKVNGLKYYRKKSYIAQALIIKDPLPADPITKKNSEGEVRFLSITSQIFKVIQEAFESGDLDDVPYKFIGGYNFIIKKTVQGDGKANYIVGTKFQAKQSDLTEDQIDLVEEKMVDLQTLLPQKPALEKVEAMLQAALTGQDYEDDSAKANSAPRSEKKQNLAQQLASAMDDDEPPFEVATKTPVNTNTPAQEDDDGDDEADEMIRRIRARRAARGE